MHIILKSRINTVYILHATVSIPIVGDMGTKLCLLLVLLHCVMTESTTIFPHCLNAPVAPK